MDGSNFKNETLFLSFRERFINYVNGFHPALKFTWEISQTCVSFLDISVSINVMRLRLPFLISLPTHTVISCFPPPTNHTKQSIHYSKFLRLCSHDKDFDTKSLRTKSLEIRTFLSDVAIRPIY